ncbi:helix-turn-helix domain-containing protein [Candidatus Woesearchaeota archaeon]|nr:helix-turn-helix domain-containing protein [Candidatus Woesearchaeota archaeon]
MPKSNFLLVDLNEPKTKKLAETITSETSRKILNHLAESSEDTETKISELLHIPLSTVHYHLQKLQEAGLIKAGEFHYSPKGREVNHYKLANKYIIIAPGKVSGLRDKLKGLLPVALVILGISALIGILNGTTQNAFKATAQEMVADSAMLSMKAQENAIMASQIAVPSRALWFLLGGVVALGLFLLWMLVREWREWREKRKKF